MSAKPRKPTKRDLFHKVVDRDARRIYKKGRELGLSRDAIVVLTQNAISYLACIDRLNAAHAKRVKP